LALVVWPGVGTRRVAGWAVPVVPQKGRGEGKKGPCRRNRKSGFQKEGRKNTQMKKTTVKEKMAPLPKKNKNHNIHIFC